MKAIGIICEYNPFHNGHLYHLNKIKETYPDYTVILVLSGFFTQRGNFSILTKYDKTKIALELGVDLIVELPFVFATQSADVFAKGAIQILNELDVRKIVFGSECDDITYLNKIVDIQNTNDYDMLIKQFQDNGYSYPTSISLALKELCNYDIKSPNDLLALSYINNIKKLNSNIEAVTIKRTSDYHSINTDNNIISASAIRNLLKNNETVENFVPNNVLNYNFFNIDLDKYFNLLKFKIISEQKFLNIYQTVDEGIENRLIKYINECKSLNEFIEKVKTKRYTYNRINRMFIHILCSFTKEEANNFKDIEYIRLLGFNEKGKEYLNKIKKECNIPIISKFSSIDSDMLKLEQRVTNIYSYIFNINEINKQEYQSFPIIMD